MGATASSSSSSSSTISSPQKKYDVFISFRGPDTRRTITRRLRDALLEYQIKAFTDDQINKGDYFPRALFKTIKQSQVAVIIFSPNYVSSKWCLHELVWILGCRNKGHDVLPLFYGVDPSEVRYLTRTFGEEFQKYERHSNLNQDRLNEWRSALNKATDRAGLCSQPYLDESNLIRDIEKVVLRELESKPLVRELKCPFGINENLAPIESLFSEVQTIGIWGMQGIGKTTIAKWLYDKYSSQYEGSCFLANIRENSGQQLYDLRNELFSKILGEDERTTNRESTFEKSRLYGKSVLIVLDDVSTSRQLEYLVGEIKCFGSGSRIIITTRYEHVLTNGRVDAIHKVKELNSQESLELFCLNAFNQNRPIWGYEKLSEKAVAYAKGLPLTLELLGSFLQAEIESEEEPQIVLIEEGEIFLDKQCSFYSFISSAAFHSKKNDVFISFKSGDTCGNFTSKLDEALHGKQKKTHINANVHGGDENLTELFKVIEESHISLIIFSENYVSSERCLDELVKILECWKKRQVVIPVFYIVKPTDVRKQSESIKCGQDKKWKEALVFATRIAGWVFPGDGDDEPELIDKIVEDVLLKLEVLAMQIKIIEGQM